VILGGITMKKAHDKVVKCPKCNYIRTAGDNLVLDRICPSCGIVFPQGLDVCCIWLSLIKNQFSHWRNHYFKQHGMGWCFI